MRAGVLAGATASALLLAGGCVGSSADVTRIRMVVMDGNVRAPGDECAGSGPYLYVHATAPYAVHRPGGAVVATGELPAGRAFEANPSIDWTVPRVPTYCVLELEVEGLTSPGAYELRLERGAALDFELPGDIDEDGVVVLAVT